MQADQHSLQVDRLCLFKVLSGIIRNDQKKQASFDPRKPVSISFNVMSLISSLSVDSNGVDLFTMQSAKYEQITTKFTLSVTGTQTGPGVRPVDKSFFRLKTGLHQATLSLARSVQGPQVSVDMSIMVTCNVVCHQDIELELLMEMYYLSRYTGSALAKIYIYVTPYEF